jgi:hypothetical protein
MRIKLNHIAPGFAAARSVERSLSRPSPAPILILSCHMAPIPKSHTCWGTTNRTTTKPTPRTANWTCPFNTQTCQA